jgi:hypothetical protein
VWTAKNYPRRHVAIPPICAFPEQTEQEGPMNNLLRDPFNVIAALTVVVLAVEIVAVHW